jgi:hypothetical protein
MPVSNASMIPVLARAYLASVRVPPVLDPEMLERAEPHPAAPMRYAERPWTWTDMIRALVAPLRRRRPEATLGTPALRVVRGARVSPPARVPDRRDSAAGRSPETPLARCQRS